MVGQRLRRRTFLAGMATATFAPALAAKEEVIDLQWIDLLPEGSSPVPQGLSATIDHDAAPMSAQQPPSSGRRSEWNGKLVRLPGFIVPIDQTGEGVTSFILVPFVGACVHVPPPPANQLVFVTAGTPYASSGLFEAVHVTGRFGTASTFTHIAQVGYALTADKIERIKL